MDAQHQLLRLHTSSSEWLPHHLNSMWPQLAEEDTHLVPVSPAGEGMCSPRGTQALLSALCLAGKKELLKRNTQLLQEPL